MSNDWNGQKVLVTGARGFLGAGVAQRLVELGATVYGAARVRPSADAGIRWLQGDVADRSAIRRMLQDARPDVVFHLAGKTNASHSKDLVVPTIESNLVSTVLILLEALDSGTPRVVTTGSLEAPQTDQWSSGAKVSPYGVSKWASVVYARMIHELFGQPVSIVRPYMTYGPRQNPAKLIPYVALSLLRGDVPIVNQPDRTVDWVYVDDVVEGMIAAGLAADAVGRTIDLGSGELASIQDVVECIEKIMAAPGRVRLQVSDQPIGSGGKRANTEEAVQILSWKAATPLATGLSKTIAWYRERLHDF